MSELISIPKDRVMKSWLERAKAQSLPSNVLQFIIRAGKAAAGKDISISDSEIHEARAAVEFLKDCEKSESRITRIGAAIKKYNRDKREAENKKKVAAIVNEVTAAKKGSQFIPAFSTKDPIRHEALCECEQKKIVARREWQGGAHPYFYVRQ